MQVNSLHLLNFTLKAKHLVQLATVTRLEHLSLDNVTLEARNTIQRLTSLQVGCLGIGFCSPLKSDQFLLWDFNMLPLHRATGLRKIRSDCGNIFVEMHVEHQLLCNAC